MAFQPGDLIESWSGSRYILREPLGSGFWGTVWSADSLDLKMPVALKLIPLEYNAYIDEYEIAPFMPEVMAHVYLNQSPYCDRNITCLYDAFVISTTHGTYGVLVLDLMKGDLEHKSISDNEIPLIMRALLDGLATIHHQGLSHQDIYLKNILYQDHTYKIGDLGIICSHHVTATEIEVVIPTGPKDVQRGEHRPLIPTCKYVFPEVEEGDDEDSAFEKAKQRDIRDMGHLLDEIIFPLNPTHVRREIIREPYPRREPDTISGRDIIYLVNRMLAMDWSIDQLRDYFYSHLRQPLPTN